MIKNNSIYYFFNVPAYLSLIGCYYWVVCYFSEQNNPQRDELITGFMMMAWLTSPAWLGIVVFAVVRRNSLIKSEKIMGLLPALLIIVAFVSILVFK